MSIFSDNITNSTPLQKFHDDIEQWIYDILSGLLKINRDGDPGDPHIIASIINTELSKAPVQLLFEDHQMYHPWASCEFSLNLQQDYCISIMIKYSDNPDIYEDNKSRIFLIIKIPIWKILAIGYCNEIMTK